ncbi:glycosyltransferase [Leuconostoc citreum]|uniref:glycosyltransferase n=1 Tax=Leuconostoc citreum TaxID=33964 RepID=UPI00200A63B7|nr:glycosyltransferase [Leuconostoc citreum]MCK8604573.1 glycosyltransferase [Leuconostoc citreum]
MNNPAVAILMSTYNGERFLTEQINSILNQSYQNIHLFIRDDGSSDKTLDLLKKFEKSPLITVSIDNNNLGYKNSFLTLIQSVLNQKERFKYFAFSDQDDVWHREKIFSAVKLLEKNNQNSFRLYYTGLTFVDEHLNTLRVKKETQTVITFGAEIVRHSVSGATVVFSRELGEKVVQYEDVFQIRDGHDALIFRINAALEGKFIYDESNFIKFRRHNSNTSNATSGLLNKIRNELLNSNSSEIDTAKFIKRHFSEILSYQISNEIDTLLNYQKSLINKYKLIKHKSFRREKKIMNILFMYRIIFNKI